MLTDISRRAVLGGGGLTALAVAAVPAASLASLPSIEHHWQERARAYREFDADPEALEDKERADDYWGRIDVAEAAILNNPDKDLRAAELRLWVAWSHCDETNREAVSQGDVPALLRIRDCLDWHEKLIFAAILNLRGEG